MKNIIVYVKTGCPWCIGVLNLLKEKGVKYEERNVTESKAFMDEMVQKSGQAKTPTLDIDGHILADSDKDQVAAYMKL